MDKEDIKKIICDEIDKAKEENVIISPPHMINGIVFVDIFINEEEFKISYKCNYKAKEKNG